MERVELKTKDGIAIVGDYYPPAGSSARGLLLAHMMPATRASWKSFAERMAKSGFHVLAIDLRGHGESQGGPEGYKQFGDADHQASREDIEAGAVWLANMGVAALHVGGASIGANLALQYLAEHPEAKSAVALSPGLGYRGVQTEPAVRSFREDQAVYYAASRDDEYSASSVQQLFDATPEGVEKEIVLFETAGHG
ncbi:alpha/beta fold hydrolase, partial [Candidatus Parcubacteria bacterium]